jgi:chromodomain-helicase-DNA-binding protein 4
VDQFREVLRVHLLRRVKSDVFKTLPQKAEVFVPVGLSPLQKDLYKKLLAKDVLQLMKVHKV